MKKKFKLAVVKEGNVCVYVSEDGERKAIHSSNPTKYGWFEVSDPLIEEVFPANIEELEFNANKKIITTNVFNLDELKQKIELVEEIIAEYRLGARYVDLASRYGISMATVCKIMKENR